MFVLVFELLEGGEILEVPTDKPLTEKDAWLAFRDVVLGMEYCKFNESETFTATSYKNKPSF